MPITLSTRKLQMNKMRCRRKIQCNTCGCTLNRTKTFKVNATDIWAACAEADEKVEAWKDSLKGKNCKTCQSIIDSR